MNDNALGIMLKEARLAKGLTQLEVAQAVGVHKSNVSQWERGSRIPWSWSDPQAVYLCNVLNIALYEVYQPLYIRATAERTLSKLDGIPIQEALREYLQQVGADLGAAEIVSEINESLVLYVRHGFMEVDAPTESHQKNAEARAQAIASILSLGFLLADAEQIDGYKAVVEQYLYRIDQLHKQQAGTG